MLYRNFTSKSISIRASLDGLDHSGPFRSIRAGHQLDFVPRNKKNGGNTYQLEPIVKPNLCKIGEMLEEVIWGEFTPVSSCRLSSCCRFLLKTHHNYEFDKYNLANTENYTFDTDTVNAKVLNINNSVWSWKPLETYSMLHRLCRTIRYSIIEFNLNLFSKPEKVHRRLRLLIPERYRFIVQTHVFTDNSQGQYYQLMGNLAQTWTCPRMTIIW